MKNLKAWIQRCEKAEKKEELDYSLSLAYKEAKELIQQVKDLKRQSNYYEMAADQWMEEYDKLKNKYESMVAVITD